MTKFCTMAPGICGFSEWNSFVIFLPPRILRWFLDFLKIRWSKRVQVTVSALLWLAHKTERRMWVRDLRGRQIRGAVRGNINGEIWYDNMSAYLWGISLFCLMLCALWGVLVNISANSVSFRTNILRVYEYLAMCCTPTLQTAAAVGGVGWSVFTAQIDRRKQHVWLPNFPAGTQIHIKSIMPCAMRSLPPVPSSVQCASFTGKNVKVQRSTHRSVCSRKRWLASPWGGSHSFRRPAVGSTPENTNIIMSSHAVVPPRWRGQKHNAICRMSSLRWECGRRICNSGPKPVECSWLKL